MELKSLGKPIFQCTCLLLTFSMIAMPLLEIVHCPIHDKEPCVDPHVETNTFVSLGSINPQGKQGASSGSISL